MEAALQQTIDYVKERKAFNQAVIEFQNTKFKLAEQKTQTKIARVFLDHCISELIKGDLDTETASMAKWWCTEKQFELMHECLQLHGGYGYMMEYPIATLFCRFPSANDLRRHQRNHERVDWPFPVDSRCLSQGLLQRAFFLRRDETMSRANLYDFFRSHWELNNEFLIDDNGTHVSYADVDDKSARVTAALASLGLKPGDRVSVQAGKSTDYLWLYFGCLRGGFIFHPLNPAYTKSELDYFFANAEPHVIIHDESREDTLQAGPPSWCAVAVYDAKRWRW